MKSLKWMIALAGVMFAGLASAEPVRLCTGGASGVYYAAGENIKQMAGNTLAIEVVETSGTIDNLRRTLDTGDCDAMIGQPDGPVYLMRQSPAAVKKLRQVGSLHREYLHVLCKKSANVSDLYYMYDGKNGSLAIGEPGSGAWLIWQNIVAQDESYASIPVTNESGIMALSAIASPGSVSCMLVPAGLRNGTLMEANATFADNVTLVGANYRKFTAAKGINGEPLYEYADIPGGTYDALNPKGWVSSGAVTTLSWNAAVFINTDRFTNPRQLQDFVTIVNRAAIGIKAEYGK